jgi:flavin reductase (DIM6/NTAB) family NADH-FMN oxidoreductase RutF
MSLQGESVHEVAGGLPCLTSAVAWLSCEVRRTCDWGDGTAEGAASHALYVGEVVDAGESPPSVPGREAPPDILRMEDTRMSYGG